MKIAAAVTVTLLGLAFCCPESAQDHAILPEQCRADVHLWASQGKTTDSKLSFDDLQRRSLEMWNCQSVDTGAGESASTFGTDVETYRLVWTAYQNQSGQRLMHFIQRHGLAKQFIAEDAADQR
jgi:hypothetical protein